MNIARMAPFPTLFQALTWLVVLAVVVGGSTVAAAQELDPIETIQAVETIDAPDTPAPSSVLEQEGLHPKVEDFAPFILTVPGEAMLLEPAAPPEPSAPANYELRESERGSASWYNARFQRKRTASGELYDRNDFTAAHRTLPFGSRVCVRSLLTGRAVAVRINDRGPFHAGRIIDLSQAAAEKIGPPSAPAKGLGLKQVSLAPMEDTDTLCQDSTPASVGIPSTDLGRPIAPLLHSTSGLSPLPLAPALP